MNVQPTNASDKINDAQRRAIFAAGRDRGMGIYELRDLTPAGSISMLTMQQASQLLDRLKHGRPTARPRRRKRRPKNVHAFVADQQRAKILALKIDLGWTTEGLDDWLSKRHFLDGRPMNKIDSSDDGVRVIELLKNIILRTESAQEKRQRSAAHANVA